MFFRLSAVASHLERIFFLCRIYSLFKTGQYIRAAPRYLISEQRAPKCVDVHEKVGASKAFGFPPLKNANGQTNRISPRTVKNESRVNFRFNLHSLNIIESLTAFDRSRSDPVREEANRRSETTRAAGAGCLSVSVPS